MSPKSHSNNVSSSPSPSLGRRIMLLARVVPLFPEVLNERFKAAGRYTPERRIWIQFLTPFTIMEVDHRGNWGFDRLGDTHEALVTKILGHFEALLDMEPSTVCEHFRFPRLQTLGQEPHEKALVSLSRCLVTPPVAMQVDLFNALAGLRDALDNSKDPLPPEVEKSSTSTRPVVLPAITDALSTLAKNWCLNCQPSHNGKAALLLSSHHKGEQDDVTILDVLLSSRVKKRDFAWRETSIAIRRSRPRRAVKLVGPSESQPSMHPQKTPVGSICPILQDREGHGHRLNFDVTSGDLFQLPNTALELAEFTDADTITLAEGFLSSDQKELEPRIRLCLALFLSYSVFNFCAGSSVTEEWDKHTIYLMQGPTTMHLTPMLIYEMPKSRALNFHKTYSISRTSYEVRLLRHSILLMEIFTQHPFKTAFNVETENDLAAYRIYAQGLAGEIPWDVHTLFQQAVNSCILGAGVDSAMASVDLNDLEVMRHYYDTVIGPLEKEFRTSWGTKLTPAKVITDLRLPRISRKKPTVGPKPAHLMRSFVRLKKQFTQATSHALLRPIDLPSPKAKLFDDDTVPNAIETQGACRWLEKCEAPYVWKNMPKRLKGKKRIRVAILDTGINLKNPQISQIRGRLECWPSAEACHDNDGHGTHVVYLLSRLAPHTELHVARISDSNLMEDADLVQIEKAIVHFSAGEDPVDIINISFGFPRFEERLRPILNAIRDARRNHVLFFVAAGNDGGNRGVAWPASLHDTGDVIRINSSDCDGRPSAFSSDSGHAHRIHTLGEGLPSCESHPTLGMICRSGTSFSTPIAAAISAIVLGVMENATIHEESQSFQDEYGSFLRRLRTPIGMERVLRDTCVLPASRYTARQYSYIAPWFFLELERSSRVHLVLNNLRDISE